MTYSSNNKINKKTLNKEIKTKKNTRVGKKHSNTKINDETIITQQPLPSQPLPSQPLPLLNKNNQHVIQKAIKKSLFKIPILKIPKYKSRSESLKTSINKPILNKIKKIIKKNDTSHQSVALTNCSSDFVNDLKINIISNISNKKEEYDVYVVLLSHYLIYNKSDIMDSIKRIEIILNIKLSEKIGKLLKEASIQKNKDKYAFIEKTPNIFNFYIDGKQIIMTGCNYNDEPYHTSSIIGKILNDTNKKYLIIINNPLYVERHINGIMQGVYNFTKYNKKKCKMPVIDFYHDEYLHIDQTKITDCIKINKIQYEIRNLVNEPVNILNSKTYLEYIKNTFHKYKDLDIKITVLDKKKLIKEKLNLILAVNKGSVNEPMLIIIEFMNNKTDKDVTCLVGKGVMFDTGGINLKKNDFKDMKGDMTGTAIIVGAIKALAELNIKKNVIGVLPIVQNDIGPNATHPGDVIISYSGKSVEIVDTDAEGRLILADAINYCKNFSPSRIIDIATLTGAAKLLFKEKTTIILGNSTKFKNEIIEAGVQENEQVAPLYIYLKNIEFLKSDIADIKNFSQNIDNSTITAAGFLSNFLPDDNIPWVHVDIAAVSYRTSNSDIFFPGGTGVFFRTLLNYLMSNIPNTPKNKKNN